ncbi:MAG TPA: cupin domain-containing protein [Sedimenticola sp.]|nr:cupin domain-containing protein [Sedimenticola sp.]
MRGALSGYRCPLDGGELAGLACEPEVESRIVLEKDGERPWQALFGPFEPETFTDLPASHWTLLVQDVDKHVPDLAELLDAFRFLPDWRLDDIMISYAADQGSVGPHTDDYDVFLIQAAGRRQWQIHTRPVEETSYLPGLDLRILPEFEPEQEWLLEPGDILYLPPNVAHWGIAQGAGCITCSVGFRAPAFREMAAAWCEEMILHQIPKQRYRDPPLTPQADPGEITPAALEEVGRLMDRFLAQDTVRRERWFGRFVTEPKPQLEVDPLERPVSPEELPALLTELGALERNGYSRLAFIRGREQEDWLYVNGEEFPLPKKWSGLLTLLTGQRRLHRDALDPWLASPACLALITRLYNLGHLQSPVEEP